jgi:hypothetical protein
MRFRRSSILLFGALLAGCGGSDSTPFDEADDDTGAPAEDGAATDTGVPGEDGSTIDSGRADDAVAVDATPDDTTISPTDTGGPIDTGTTPTDTAVPPIDTGVPDAKVACTEPGAKVYGGHCYFRIDPTTWDVAQKTCAAAPGVVHLVTITSDGEQAFVSALGTGTDRWIGMARDATAPAVKTSYKWITGEAQTYDNWLVGEPNGTGNTVRMQADGHWADREYTYVFAAICERE